MIQRILAVAVATAALFGMQSVAVAEQSGWSTRAPMPTARNDADVVATDGIVYVIGGPGCSDTTGSVCYPLDLVEAFSPARNAWRTMAPMPAPRMHIGAALGRDGRIYVARGSGPGGVVADTFYAYSPRANSWRTLTPLPSARAEAELATANDAVISRRLTYTTPRPTHGRQPPRCRQLVPSSKLLWAVTDAFMSSVDTTTAATSARSRYTTRPLTPGRPPHHSKSRGLGWQSPQSVIAFWRLVANK